MPSSYLLTWDEQTHAFQKYNVQSYEPDPDAAKGAYPNLKYGEIEGADGVAVPDPGKWFIENDLKVEVDCAKILLLPQPWIFVQGYWHDNDYTISLRLDVANGVAWFRVKNNKLGKRRKMRYRVPYGLAKIMIYHAPGVAYKYRFLKRDDTGRAWLIEYFPEFDHWQAETEINGTDVPYPDKFPVWAGRDVSDTMRYYTHAYVIARSDKEIDYFLHDAEEYGSREVYEPGSGKPFNWIV